MDCMLLTFKKKSFSHALGVVIDVASFITTDEQVQ